MADSSIKIWFTGHEIADTVAYNVHKGTANSVIISTKNPELLDDSCHIGYGILRGMNNLTKADKYFLLDNGYFGPGHFSGSYRISYKGTQAKWHEGIPQIESGIELEDWCEHDGYILICPPTQAVAQFFGLSFDEWAEYIQKPIIEAFAQRLLYKIRHKGDNSPIEWDKIKAVYTFNSSIGWQALQRGIPCISDPEHSIVGSYYTHELRKLGLDYNFENVMKIDRKPLFRAMQAHQFTLKEISEGKAWPILKHYLT